MAALTDRIKREPVLVMALVLLVLDGLVPTEHLGRVNALLELAMYLGLGAVVRRRTTPWSPAEEPVEEVVR